MVLGHDRVTITNLCAVPTRSVVEVNSLDRTAWDQARPQLQTALLEATTALCGWSIAGLRGEAKRLLDEQVAWLSQQAKASGIDAFWMVGGQPRHPSRWHQYVSDKYGRTMGGTFQDRIAQVLVEVPLHELGA